MHSLSTLCNNFSQTRGWALDMYSTVATTLLVVALTLTFWTDSPKELKSCSELRDIVLAIF